MKQQNKFDARQNEELAAQHQATQNSVQEFAKVDDLLRHDASRTNVPSSIAERLQKSSAGFPKPSRSWWQRLFGQ